MEITVVSEEENPMLHRTDVTFRVSHVEATPDRLAVRDSLAARLNKDADEVVIRKLDTKFGMRTTYGEAKVYRSPVEAKEVEQAYMLKRNKITAGEGEAVEESEADEAATEAEAEPAEPEADEEAVEAEPEEPETADEPDEADAEAEEDEADGEAEEDEADAEAEEDEADAEAEETEADEDEETEE